MIIAQVLIKYSVYVVFFFVVSLITLMWQSQNTLADVPFTTTTGVDVGGVGGVTGNSCGNVGVGETTSAI